MNTGIFGEGFPYINFHDLNMDWIIKIAKDFLDQYTHIQEIIEQGKVDIETLTESGITQIGDLTATSLQDLQDKADNLESLLQAWYDTHSEDIANQLASALQELNDWYTLHQNYLNQTLTEKENIFSQYANERAEEAIGTIPGDYTTLYNEVQSIGESPNIPPMMQLVPQEDYLWSIGYWDNSGGSLVVNSGDTQYSAILIKNVREGYYHINNFSAGQTFLKNIKTGVATSLHDLGFTSNTATTFKITTLTDLYLTINTTVKSIKNSVFQNVWYYKNILNPYNWQVGYWNNGVRTEDANYMCTLVENLKPGIYDFSYYAYGQTGIKRRSDNTYISFWDLGYRTSNKKMTIEIDFEFDLYLTLRTTAIPYKQNTVLYHEVAVTDKLDYGVYKPSHNTFVVGPQRKMTILEEAIRIAKCFPYSKLIVDPGNYNMYEELGGATYFDNYVHDPLTPTDWYENNWGIFLNNHIHIFCEEGAEIYFIYTGTNTDVQRYFSLFNGGREGFTLENAKIRTENIRYSIHDDMGGFISPYKTQYKNCEISHDSSQSAWGNAQAIGGGFGKHGLVLFDSCKLVSTYWIPVSYHNSADSELAEFTSGVSSKLFMRDCWLSGAIVTNAYGRTTDMTEVFISGCSVGTNLPDPQITGDYGVMNIESIRWNNVVRT